jgi:hypothetical protein
MPGHVELGVMSSGAAVKTDFLAGLRIGDIRDISGGGTIGRTSPIAAIAADHAFQCPFESCGEQCRDRPHYEQHTATCNKGSGLFRSKVSIYLEHHGYEPHALLCHVTPHIWHKLSRFSGDPAPVSKFKVRFLVCSLAPPSKFLLDVAL